MPIDASSNPYDHINVDLDAAGTGAGKSIEPDDDLESAGKGAGAPATPHDFGDVEKDDPGGFHKGADVGVAHAAPGVPIEAPDDKVFEPGDDIGGTSHSALDHPADDHGGKFDEAAHDHDPGKFDIHHDDHAHGKFDDHDDLTKDLHHH
jgi:hypothetical protein